MMKFCTECYIQQDGRSLMLHRNKKKRDINAGKWVGLGGKLEAGESPEQCLLREVREEAGVVLTDYRLRGMVTFLMQEKPDESLLIFIYTASSFEGLLDLDACDEGSLQWVDTDKVLDLNLWEGDRLFWDWILHERGFFSARFVYDGEVLAKHDVNFY
jgi:8-oxo-dGTP diphosphatase